MIAITSTCRISSVQCFVSVHLHLFFRHILTSDFKAISFGGNKQSSNKNFFVFGESNFPEPSLVFTSTCYCSFVFAFGWVSIPLFSRFVPGRPRHRAKQFRCLPSLMCGRMQHGTKTLFGSNPETISVRSLWSYCPSFAVALARRLGQNPNS